jgi:hypothetical protein
VVVETVLLVQEMALVEQLTQVVVAVLLVIMSLLGVLVDQAALES